DRVAHNDFSRVNKGPLLDSANGNDHGDARVRGNGRKGVVNAQRTDVRDHNAAKRIARRAEPSTPEVQRIKKKPGQIQHGAGGDSRKPFKNPFDLIKTAIFPRTHADHLVFVVLRQIAQGEAIRPAHDYARKVLSAAQIL